ncbi:MAG: AtpZ/AtpI family protein [Nitrospira sp.]|nr:AtpZ/AtpI family protein [Nitrospira sp.]
MNNHDELKQRVIKQVARIRNAEKDRPTLLAQTVYLGTLGLLLVVPVVAGAYLGRWLDGLVEGYSLRWTLSLILVGVAVGAFNMYRFIRD